MGNPLIDAQNPDQGLRLPKGEVHIWKLRPEPEADLAEYSRLLGSAERERAARFRVAHLRHNFVVDHARMRLILGVYAGLAPEELVFAVNKFGKPELANPIGAGQQERLRFNLSHTEGLTLLAVCLDANLGVDVEAVRSMSDLEEIVRSHFSPLEIAALRAVELAERQKAFFRCWTRKEAFLKAHGRGLSIPLDSFAVSIADEDSPALLECSWNPEEFGRWALFSLAPGPEFAGALAIQRGDWRIRWFDWAGNP